MGEEMYVVNNAGCKSKMKLGNITFYNTKRFGWFHRLMFKVVFGIEIENI